MKQLVVLKLKGELDTGFWVSVEIGQEGKYPETEITGDLPPAIDLILQYKKWQSIYRKLEYTFRLKNRFDSSFARKQEGKINPIDSVTGSYLLKQKMQCYQAADLLRIKLNKWLDSSGFRRIDRRLREQLNPESEIRFLISSDSTILKGLPWHLWDILEPYSRAEIAVSSLEYQPAKVSFVPEKNEPKNREQKEKIKILAILGNSAEIDVNQDKKALLAELPNAEITFLEEPKPKQLNDRLWEQSWDILFFAGHSKTEEQTGRIHINNKDSLTIEEIKSSLKKAIAKGLKLAIFNSCDGLGLAVELEKLNLAQMVVMREPVPDRVAHQFLTYFLPVFAKGEPLHLAVRASRERLQGLETEFPCASWLPVVFQNPAVPSLSWTNLLKQPYSNIEYLPSQKVDRDEEKAAIITNKTNNDPNNLVLTKYLEEKTELAEKKETEKQQKKVAFNWSILKHTSLACLTIVAGLLIFEFIQYRIFISRNTRFETSSNNTNFNASLFDRRQIDKLPQNNTLPQIDKPYHRFEEVDEVPIGTFNYGGSNIWETIRAKTEPEINAAWPQFRLRYVKHPILGANSSTAIEMILKHQLTIALSSRRLSSEEIQQAKEKNLSIAQIPVAIDGIVFTVNPNLGINSLNVSQLRDIYSGKITNWREVGGPDLAILPYSKSPGASGTASFFQNNILDGNEFGNNIRIKSNTEEAIQLVARNYGAIFYASAPEIIGQCQTKPLGLARGDSDDFIWPYSQYNCTNNPKERINLEAFQDATYPLTRYLYVTIEKNADIHTKAGNAYVNLLLSQRGQELIRQAGFVPVR